MARTVIPVDTITSTINGAVSFLDSNGSPAPVDGVPVWTNAGDPIVTMEVSADGMSVVLTPTGVPQLGVASISVSADADLGDGVESIIASGELEFVAGRAVSGSLTFTVA